MTIKDTAVLFVFLVLPEVVKTEVHQKPLKAIKISFVYLEQNGLNNLFVVLKS